MRLLSVGGGGGGGACYPLGHDNFSVIVKLCIKGLGGGGKRGTESVNTVYLFGFSSLLINRDF